MKILIIQTAFIGDVILATPVIEKLHQYFPNAEIDFLLRKGNESLLDNHPHLRKVLIFNKQKNKYRNLYQLIRTIRATSYDKVINLQRFASSGILTALSKGKIKIGFDKNPFSAFFSIKKPHLIQSTIQSDHEVKRNLSLIKSFTDGEMVLPRLYPTREDFELVKIEHKYVTMAPASIWFTKQLPESKWIELINKLDKGLVIYLLGGKGDQALCERIKSKANSEQVRIKAGKLSFLRSAALMKNAEMNYVNDSAPLHLASAMNAPVTAFFCSTVPEFGFGPLSEHSIILPISSCLGLPSLWFARKEILPQGTF